MSDMFSLVFLMLLALAGWFIIDTMKAQELARLAGRRACTERNVQFLDDSVAGSHIRLSRDSSGRRILVRTYCFEFSPDGISRLEGRLTLSNKQLQSVELEPYQFIDVTPVSECSSAEVKSPNLERGRTFEADSVTRLNESA